MQNIRLTPKAAYALMEELREVLDSLADDDIKDVCIRAGDDIGEPLSEVEVHLSWCHVIESSKEP